MKQSHQRCSLPGKNIGQVLNGKMKYKRIFTGIPFIIGIFIVIYAGFGLVYFQKHNEWRDINSQIIPTRTVLSKPSTDLGQLESELNQIEFQFEQAWITLPNSDQGIDLYDALIEVARESNVDVISVVASSPTDEHYGGITFAILPYSINVEGSETGILNFVSNLADGPGLLESSEVTNLNITNSGSDNTTGYISSKASFQLVIYAQPGQSL